MAEEKAKLDARFRVLLGELLEDHRSTLEDWIEACAVLKASPDEGGRISFAVSRLDPSNWRG